MLQFSPCINTPGFVCLFPQRALQVHMERLEASETRKRTKHNVNMQHFPLACSSLAPYFKLFFLRSFPLSSLLACHLRSLRLHPSIAFSASCVFSLCILEVFFTFTFFAYSSTCASFLQLYNQFPVFFISSFPP